MRNPGPFRRGTYRFRKIRDEVYPMIVVDLSAVATTIHHDHGFRAVLRGASFVGAEGLGGSDLLTCDGGGTSARRI
jgi:hypothetical protein